MNNLAGQPSKTSELNIAPGSIVEVRDEEWLVTATETTEAQKLLIHVQDLREEAKLSSTTMARLNNGDNVTTDVLLRICQVLDCQIGDIVEVIPANEKKEEDA